MSLADQVAVDFKGVTFTYPGAEASAVENITLAVGTGQRLGILGPNGGGKSTLLKLALGQLNPDRGVVHVMGVSPQEACRRGMIGYVPQRMDIERGFPLSGRQVIELAAMWNASPQSRPGAAVRQRLDQLIDLVGAKTFVNKPIGALSGGQVQRVMIARALAGGAGRVGQVAGGPRVLMLDEPTVGIDIAGQQQFAALLTDVHRELGVTILLVSHDLRAVAAGCDRVACLSRTLHFHDSPAGLTPKVLAELFTHDVAGLGAMHVHAHGPDEPCPDHGVGITIKGAKP